MRLRTFLVRGLVACAVTPALLAGCGGDDDDGGEAAPKAPSGSDEAYVAIFCKASNTFGEDFFTALTSIAEDATDKEAAAAFVDPFETYVKDLRAAKPPKDVKAAHDQILSQLTDALKELKAGNNPEVIFDALESPDVDDAISARLDAAAEKNQDCIDGGVTFSSDTGG